MAKRLSKEAFVDKANKVHSRKYGYNYVDYVNTQTKIIVECFLHGQFSQRPSNHLNGSGCPQCARLDTKRDFVLKARKYHGNRYDYAGVIYKKSSSKVIIYCKEHGKFHQTPNKHIQGQGCPKCAGTQKSNTAEFIVKSKKIHGDKFGYDDVDYENAYVKVTILCPKHGRFEQDPHDHLRGKGCGQCKHPISKAEAEWLDTLSIPPQNRNVHLLLGGQRFVVDGYSPKTNTVFEFYGDYWHGNPQKYDKDNTNYHTQCTFDELYKKTLDRESKLKKYGFNIVSIWENDYKPYGMF